MTVKQFYKNGVLSEHCLQILELKKCEVNNAAKLCYEYRAQVGETPYLHP